MISLTKFIENWISKSHFMRVGIIIKSKSERSKKCREEKSIELRKKIWPISICRESILECIRQICPSNKNVFVKIEQNWKRNSSVTKSSVNQYQSFQKLKLRNCKIWRSNCLRSFLSSNSNPYVSFKNHSDIIRSVSNRKRNPSFAIFLLKSNNSSFLIRRYSTTNKRTCWKTKSEEILLYMCIFK